MPPLSEGWRSARAPGQLMPSGHLGDLGRQGHGVGRVLEEIVLLECDRVVEDLGVVLLFESERHVVADEVHFVAATGQPNAQLRGQGATAANGGGR